MKRVEPFPESSAQPWLFQVEPYPDESFGHFLGRFRRANHLSSAHLSAMLGQRSYTVAYWETPSRRRRPSMADLKQLAQWTGVDIPRLQVMWSSPGTALHWPTRLCPQCYAEAPWHCLRWQLANRSACEEHQRPLLSGCPRCQSVFQLPSYWVAGVCDGCLLSFADMALYPVVTESV